MSKYYFIVKTNYTNNIIVICAVDFIKASGTAISIMKKRYKKFTIEYIGKAIYIVERGLYVETI